MDLREVVRQGYDEIADDYDEQRPAEGRERDLAEQFAASFDDGRRFLDAGCGAGRPVLETLEDAHDVVGLDVSTAQLEIARERVPTARFARGDLAALPFDDDTFDGVVCYQAIIHVPGGEHVDVLREFHRVLHSEGELLVTMGTAPFEDSNDDWLDTGTTMAWHIHGAERNREMLRETGFTIESVDRVDDELGGAFDFYRASA